MPDRGMSESEQLGKAVSEFGGEGHLIIFFGGGRVDTQRQRARVDGHVMYRLYKKSVHLGAELVSILEERAMAGVRDKGPGVPLAYAEQECTS